MEKLSFNVQNQINQLEKEEKVRTRFKTISLEGNGEKIECSNHFHKQQNTTVGINKKNILSSGSSKAII